MFDEYRGRRAYESLETNTQKKDISLIWALEISIKEVQYLQEKLSEGAPFDKYDIITCYFISADNTD